MTKYAAAMIGVIALLGPAYAAPREQPKPAPDEDIVTPMTHVPADVVDWMGHTVDHILSDGQGASDKPRR